MILFQSYIFGHTSTTMASRIIDPAFANLPCSIRAAREKWAAALGLVHIGRNRRQHRFHWQV